ERMAMWSRIQGGRSVGGFCEIIGEKEAAIAVAQFTIDTDVLDQFRAVDSKALST
ncbi:hypothetical protein BGW36DRAFT_258970, partial [Talaromyces proteolyticus]